MRILKDCKYVLYGDKEGIKIWLKHTFNLFLRVVCGIVFILLVVVPLSNTTGYNLSFLGGLVILLMYIPFLKSVYKMYH